MIRSIKGSATRQFVEQGKSRFSGMDVELATRGLWQTNMGPTSGLCRGGAVSVCTS